MNERNRCQTSVECVANKRLHEYDIVVSSLRQDLEACKDEQSRLRLEIEASRKESQKSSEKIRETFRRTTEEHFHDDKNEKENDREKNELISNLQGRISLMEMERETALEMWKIALNAASKYEEELKNTKKNSESPNCDDRIKIVKDSYDQVIKALEKKLQEYQIAESHEKAVLQTENAAKIAKLTQENSELSAKLHEKMAKLSQFEISIDNRDRDIESLKRYIDKSNLERGAVCEKLEESRALAAKLIAQDHVTKCKIAESIELAEAAIRDKESIVKRLSYVEDEKMHLEKRFSALSDEYTRKLDEKMGIFRDKTLSKLSLEVEKSKNELRDKSIIIDKVAREKARISEEFENLRKDYEEYRFRAAATIRDIEEKLKKANEKMENCEKTFRLSSEKKIRELELEIARFAQIREKRKNLEDREFRDIEEKNRDLHERCEELERKVRKIAAERDDRIRDIDSMRANNAREIQIRENTKIVQDAKIRDLRDQLTGTNEKLEISSQRLIAITKQLENCQINTELGVDTTMGNLKLQEQFDRRVKELTRHVEIHRKLCKRWKDEVKSLTAKFHTRSREHREKMSQLRKENAKISGELLACRRYLGQFEARGDLRRKNVEETT